MATVDGLSLEAYEARKQQQLEAEAEAAGLTVVELEAARRMGWDPKRYAAALRAHRESGGRIADVSRALSDFDEAA